jgi:hypothetical protein
MRPPRRRRSDALFARIDAARAATFARLPPRPPPGADAGRPHVDARTACIEEALAQIDAARRSALDRRGALAAATQRGDTDAERHELAIVDVLVQRVETLAASAASCRN